MPRPLALALLAASLAGCNEIRYQAGRLRAAAPPLETPKVAELPDRRATYECKNGEPFDVYFPPGGVGAVLSLGGDEFALREQTAPAGAGVRYADDRYELFIKDEVASVSLDDKRIRDGCRRRP